MSTNSYYIDTRNLPEDLKLALYCTAYFDPYGLPDQRLVYEFHDKHGLILTGELDISPDHRQGESWPTKIFSVKESRAKNGYLASDESISSVIHCLMALGFTQMHRTEDKKFLQENLGFSTEDQNDLSRFNVTPASFDAWVSQLKTAA